MRDLLKALSDLETRLSEVYGVTLNEAMVLCSVGADTVSAGHIMSCTGMTSSHASKIIRSVEDKGLVLRKLGDKDKRQMYFTLTRKGKTCLEQLKTQGVEIPEWLLPLFATPD